MPSRKKVKSAKKPKKDSGISINIKNVVKQVQNERQRTDFLFPQRDPRRNLNTGSMTRLINPAITYASTPLSSFPSLSSIVSAPPQSQLKSRSQIPINNTPEISPALIKSDDAMVPVMSQTRITPSQPLVSAYDAASSQYGNPTVAELPAPIEKYLVPSGISSRLLDSYDGKDAPQEDESQFAVAAAMDQDVRNQAEMNPDVLRNMDTVEEISVLYERLRGEKAGSPIIPIINRQIKKLEKKLTRKP